MTRTIITRFNGTCTKSFNYIMLQAENYMYRDMHNTASDYTLRGARHWFVLRQVTCYTINRQIVEEFNFVCSFFTILLTIGIDCNIRRGGGGNFPTIDTPAPHAIRFGGIDGIFADYRVFYNSYVIVVHCVQRLYREYFLTVTRAEETLFN